MTLWLRRDQILDVVLNGNESVDLQKANNVLGVIYKLDVGWEPVGETGSLRVFL